MEFNINDDVIYLFIEDVNKSIFRLERNYEWDVELIDGDELNLGTLFSNLDPDEIVASLRKRFALVELIDEEDIDDYME